MSARALACLFVLQSACIARSPAPVAWQRSMDDVKTVTYGAWTRVEGRSFVSDGELLAAERRYLALSRGDEVTIVPSGCIEKVKIAAFEGAPGPTILWGVAGSLSTASHGVYLLFTLPIWLITTAGASYAHSAAGYVRADYQKPLTAELDMIRKWARFPQGLPPGYLQQAEAVHHAGTGCASTKQLPLPVHAPSKNFE
jgi:hypothetical protein